MLDENELPQTHAIGEQRLSLPDMLRRTAVHLEGGQPELSDSSLLDAAQAIAITASEAIRQPRPLEWAEYRIMLPKSQDNSSLYAALAACARKELAERAEDFFFMHKSPGLRIRFRAREMQLRPSKVFASVEVQLNDWVRDGLIADWTRAVYEPEQHLFGGPISMESVHRIFTIDSLTWLNFWAKRNPDRPVWAFSLHMIEAIFANLGIVGWEDRDVWDRIRQKGMRSFGGNKPRGWEELSLKIRQVWSEPGRLDTVISPWGHGLAEDFRYALPRECEAWIKNYFASPLAYVGPREAASYLIIFHWNRSRLAFSWQCAITEALAD
jgi:thiopeptide-type bacteriocin biosynthesis protein